MIRRVAAGSSERDHPSPEQRDGRPHRCHVPRCEEIDGRQRRHEVERDHGEQQPAAQQHEGRRPRGRRFDPDAVTHPGEQGAEEHRHDQYGWCQDHRESHRRRVARDREGRSPVPQRGELDRQGNDAGGHDHRDRNQSANGHLGLPASPSDERVERLGHEDERVEVVHPHDRDGEQGVYEGERPAAPVIEPTNERVGGCDDREGRQGIGSRFRRLEGHRLGGREYEDGEPGRLSADQVSERADRAAPRRPRSRSATGDAGPPRSSRRRSGPPRRSSSRAATDRGT